MTETVAANRGAEVGVSFWVGDDIEGARVSGDLSAWSLLEVRVVQHSPEDALRFSFNGMVLEPDSVSTHYGGMVATSAVRAGLPERINTYRESHAAPSAFCRPG